MLTVEQTLTCDICGSEMQTLKQTAKGGVAIQYINRPHYAGVTHWSDVCKDCFGPLQSAFWALKMEAKDESTV